jgi:4-amino-4-deoxy-L-arabinose transferase-like glycosyltransferase
MLAAFVVLPTFVLVYLLGSSLTWRRRVFDLVLAGAILIAFSVPWTLAYDLTSPDRRPFAGSTTHNSWWSWRSDIPSSRRLAARMDAMQLYDLRPD